MEPPPSQVPRPWEGFLLVGLSVVIFSVGAPLAQGGLQARFLLLPAAAFLLPAVAWALFRGRLSQTFPWRALTGRSLVVAVSLIAGGSLVALSLAGLLTAIFGESGETPALRTLLLSVGPSWRLIYFAVAPALCEEALFRGALLRCVRPWGIGVASLVSGLAFAAVHASWIKFLPIAVLGWALAQVVLRTGNFWFGVAGHALHNAVILWLVGWGGGAATAEPAGVDLTAVALVAALSVLLFSIRRFIGESGWSLDRAPARGIAGPPGTRFPS